MLPDGTNVKMNTDTSMNVSYGRETRLVNLQSGEAYFEVAHNTVKPFVVRTGNYLVRATGTAFSVKLLDNNLDILVTNGHVDVKALKYARAIRLNTSAGIKTSSVCRQYTGFTVCGSF